jgi:hypothetical protein
MQKNGFLESTGKSVFFVNARRTKSQEECQKQCEIKEDFA